MTEQLLALPGRAYPAAVLALSAAVESRSGDPKIARARLDEAQIAAAEAEAPELEYEIHFRASGRAIEARRG